MHDSIDVSYMFGLICKQEIQARVGLRRNASAEANGDAEGGFASTSHSTSTISQGQRSNAAVNEYLVGTQLDEALVSGQDIIISWPFTDGDIKDWVQAEAIW